MQTDTILISVGVTVATLLLLSAWCRSQPQPAERSEIGYHRRNFIERYGPGWFLMIIGVCVTVGATIALFNAPLDERQQVKSAHDSIQQLRRDFSHKINDTFFASTSERADIYADIHSAISEVEREHTETVKQYLERDPAISQEKRMAVLTSLGTTLVAAMMLFCYGFLLTINS